MFLQKKRETLRKKYISAIIIGSMLLIFSGVGVFAMKNPDTGVSEEKNSTTTDTKVYKTTSPKKMKDEQLLLIGKVLSHESASVYTRRVGIVEDILVDIGDRVEKGQILAYLLPEGVDSESGLEIQSKKNEMQKAYDDYQNTTAVSSAHIENLKQKLEEKKVALETLKQDNYTNTYDTTGLRMEDETIQVEYDQLDIAQTELQEAKQLEKVAVKQAQDTVAQAKDTLKVALYDTHLVALQVLGGGSKFSKVGFSSDISQNDIPLSLWVFSRNDLYDVVNELNAYRSKLRIFDASQNRTDEMYTQLTDQAESLLERLQTVVNSSFGVSADAGMTLDSLAISIQNAQSKLYSANEKYEKAQNNLLEVDVKQREKISVLEEKLVKQQSSIALLNEKWSKSNVEVSSKIKILEANIAQFEKEIAYAKTVVQKEIDASKNQYSIANTGYQKTAVQKGRSAIRAPFSGVISKRSINVGEIAMTSIPAFDMVDVKTSLSAKAKNEIQFGLPEGEKDIIKVGDLVQFFLPDDELTVYEATVTRISPQIDEELHTIMVQAKIDDELSFPQHTSVQVRIITGEKDTYSIDSSALKREDDKNYLWVQGDEEAQPKKVYIDVMGEDGEFAEISGEISESSTLLLNYYGGK